MKIDTDKMREISDRMMFAGDAPDLIRAAADLIDKLRAAGFITNDGEARKVLGTLPMLKTGEIVGNHATVWAADTTEVFILRIDNIGATDTADSDAFFEAGELFSTREAAEAARNNTPSGKAAESEK